MAAPKTTHDEEMDSYFEARRLHDQLDDLRHAEGGLSRIALRVMWSELNHYFDENKPVRPADAFPAHYKVASAASSEDDDTVIMSHLTFGQKLENIHRGDCFWMEKGKLVRMALRRDPAQLAASFGPNYETAMRETFQKEGAVTVRRKLGAPAVK